MKNKKFSAYLYDLDGTLLDSFPDLIAAIKQALTPLEIENINDVRNQVSFGGAAMMKTAINNRLDEKQSSEKLNEFLELYFSNSTIHSRLFDGIQQLIDHHQKHSQKWAIVSNKLHQPTQDIAKKFNLKADVILGRGLLEKAKPHPEPLFYVCEQIGVRAEDCLFIGDHQNDILAAKSANMPSALVGWGYFENINHLIALKPEYLINHPSELIGM